jgi:DNA (cytosine-5)-methyltransferase 1
MNSPLKVIDLFAGPGGLGEGFSCIKNGSRKVFDIAVSIEKERSAHKTLLLRSFFRQFETGDAPAEYYQFLEGNLGKDPEDRLYKIPKYRKHIESARKEARCLELGEKNRDILSAIRESVGRSECIVIGGPPCQAYSLVGRSRNAGKRDYIPEKDERNYLYFEYLKVIAKFQPQVFVMENVKGLLSAKVENKSIFKDIKLQLAHPCRTARQRPEPGRKSHEYRIVSMVVPDTSSELKPSDFIIHSEHYGVPQMRHRVILLGIREDIQNNLIPSKTGLQQFNLLKAFYQSSKRMV